MTDSNITRVRNAIKEKVSLIGSLSYVYEYETANTTGTPFATVTPSRGNNDFGDSSGSQSGRNLQTMEFVVRVYQARDTDDFEAQRAESISLTVLDELLTAFQNDTTLSGVVLWQRPTDWFMEYEIIDQIVRTLQVTITAVKDINSK